LCGEIKRLLGCADLAVGIFVVDNNQIDEKALPFIIKFRLEVEKQPANPAHGSMLTTATS